MDVWSGNIVLPDGNSISDIQLSAPHATHVTLPASPLRFLAVVDVSRIPLNLAAGPSFDVWTSSEKTESWFSGHILDEQVTALHNGWAGLDAQRWWETSAQQSSLGVLARVEVQGARSFIPRVTEVLFYGTASIQAEEDARPTPESLSPEPVKGETASTAVSGWHLPIFRLHALPLSSDLLQDTSTARPPSPPPDGLSTEEDDVHAQFLPPSIEVPLPPPIVQDSQKRPSVSDIFDEANNRRKRAKRHGGESVAAAASKANPAPMSLPHRRSGSQDIKLPANGGQEAQSDFKAAPRTARSLSRSPSLNSDTRPLSRKGFLDGGAKPSSLSRVTSISNMDEEPTTETRNKDVISRLVMAGMRMYGLQPRKKDVKPRRNSVAPMSMEEKIEEAQTADEMARDEEYKLVYHQAYKGAVFALRDHIATQPLHQQPDQLRDTVDKLLAIFCTDPLTALTAPSVAVTTPADQKKRATFGDNVDEPEKSPFDQSKLHTTEQGLRKADLTGCVHRPNTRRTLSQEG